jgi:hypothetical protein
VVRERVSLVAGIADVNETDLDLVGRDRLAGKRAAGEGEEKRQGQNQDKQLLHQDFPPCPL